MTWTSAACLAAKHENCKGERIIRDVRPNAPLPREVREGCHCGCHEKETAGIHMKEAFAR